MTEFLEDGFFLWLKRWGKSDRRNLFCLIGGGVWWLLSAGLPLNLVDNIFLCFDWLFVFIRASVSNVHASCKSVLHSTLVVQTVAITDKIQVPINRCINRGLTENDSRYYGLLLFRTQNDVPKVSAITWVDCIRKWEIAILIWYDNSIDGSFVVAYMWSLIAFSVQNGKPGKRFIGFSYFYMVLITDKIAFFAHSFYYFEPSTNYLV